MIAPGRFNEACVRVFVCVCVQKMQRQQPHLAVSAVCMALKKADPLPPTLSAPVFSLATLNDDGSTNMNIITYVVPVGIRPTRKWIISLWQGTLSHSNFSKRRRGVLQLLRRRHAALIPLLGKQSGAKVDKQQESAAAGFPWTALVPDSLHSGREGGGTTAESGGAGSIESKSPLLLPGCAAYYPLSFPEGSEYQNAGEHDAAMCDLEGVYVQEGEDVGIEAERVGEAAVDSVLYTAWLRAQGIIE